MKPVLSIVVPVYNVERYITKCMECLINQSLRDIEIILVNDGSTDSSMAICESYAAKDARVRLFSKTNGGLSDARNYGMARAEADVIGFVDSDDTIDLDMFEKLLHMKQEYNCQIAVAAVKMVNDKGEVYQFRAVEGTVVKNRHDAMAELLSSKRILNAVWNKIFDRVLLQDVLFPVGKLYEDEFFTYRVFDRADQIVMTDCVSYHYRQNPGSITHRKFSDKELDRVEASIIKVDFCQNFYPDLIFLAQRYLVYDCVMTMSKMTDYDKKYDYLLKKNLRQYWKVFITGKNSVSAKLFATVGVLSPTAAVWLYNWRKKNEE